MSTKEYKNKYIPRGHPEDKGALTGGLYRACEAVKSCT